MIKFYKKVGLVITTLIILCSNNLNGLTKQTVKIGYATYYDYGFRGNPTASGLIYNPKELTCATKDRSIPFGTVILITNIKNGKTVKVTVTDRMSKNAKRQLDLTPAAFKRIGQLKTGVLKVKYKIIKIGSGKTYHHLNSYI